MSADDLPDSTRDSQGNGNSDYQWAQFDPESYFHHYYGDPHPDDDRVTQLAAIALAAAGADKELDVIDVGTGPNLIPFMAALPRAKSLTAWEYSPANITWLNGELRGSQLRPQWLHFWRAVQDSLGTNHRLPDDPLPQMRAKAKVVEGSIFDLPEARWDAATMFFCAESITQRRDEFEAACASVVRCLKPGGTLAAAFLVRSEGYDVSGRRFPALKLSPEEIEGVFQTLARDVQIERIGLVDEEVRSGYTGALFLTARR